MSAWGRLERQLVKAVVSAAPVVPDAGRLLWRVFRDLHATRVYSMAGAQPISHREVEAFLRIERLPLRRDHVAILRAMDDAWLAKARRQAANVGPDGMKRLAPVSSKEMTAGMFDVMFGA